MRRSASSSQHAHMLVRAILLGMCACAVALAAGGCVAVQSKSDGTWGLSLLPPSASVPPTSTGAVSAVGQAVLPASASGPAMPGSALTSGPWKVTVESAGVVKKLPDGTKAPGGKELLVVGVSARNIGSGAALIVRPAQFAMKDAGGKAVAPLPTKLAAFNAAQVRPIDPGMGGFTQFVYELPTGASGYRFTMTPQQGASGSLSWSVP